MKEQKFNIERTNEEINDRLSEELQQSAEGNYYSQGFSSAILWMTSKNINKKKVYISGAIAHLNLNERKEAFKKAADTLESLGYWPINPFCNGLPDEADWRAHMKADIGLLLNCEAIYMLKGWELSKGCKLELDVATSCGIQVMFEKV